MVDEDHRHRRCPLQETGLGLVSAFPLDYMHLVCLGVTKRLLRLLIKGPLRCRMQSCKINGISDALIAVRNNIPKEFARRPRSLKEIDRWKATEFRQFLLYTGILVLKEHVKTEVYRHFLILSVAMHILLNPALCQLYCDYAQQLLLTFVKQVECIYGRDQLVYNVHGLLHLAHEANKFGSLDNISSFPYENFLHRLKRLIRKPSSPLQQVIRRLSEEKSSPRQTCSCGQKTTKADCKKEHMNGPLPPNTNHCRQYTELRLDSYSISSSPSDSCIKVKDSLGVVRNILLNDKVTVVYEVFKSVDNFFDYPLPSGCLGIHRVAKLDGVLHTCSVSEIKCKFTMLPCKGGYLVIALTHQVW